MKKIYNLSDMKIGMVVEFHKTWPAILVNITQNTNGVHFGWFYYLTHQKTYARNLHIFFKEINEGRVEVLYEE